MGLGLAEPGFHTRAYVEWEEYPRSVIIAAQRAGYLAPAPIWDDLTTFDAKPLAGAIDTVLAGYPCQPFSYAGQRKGEDDERHLWPHVARVIEELGDGLRWVFLENVSGHVTLGGEAVLRALRDMGFTPSVGLFTAAETGAPHQRERWFCVAHKPGRGCGVERDAAQPGRGRHADGGGGVVENTTSAGTGGERVALGERGRDALDRWREGIRRGDGAPCSDGHRADGGELAYPNGRDASAEREQRGGELGFQPEGDGDGGSAVDDTGRSERRAGLEAGHIGDWQAPERHEGADRPEQSGDDVDHSASARCDAARIGAAPNSEGRQCLPGAGCDGLADAQSDQRRSEQPEGQKGSGWPGFAGDGWKLADSCGPEREGQQRGEHQPGGRKVSDGHLALPRRTGLFPPGPGDRDAWDHVASAAPSLLPAVSRRDIYTASRRLAAMVGSDTAARILDRTTGLESLDQLAALVSEEIAVVEQAEAVTTLCRMAHGLAARTRALRLLGNGVHPLAASHAWRSLSHAHGLRPVDMDTAGPENTPAADEPLVRE